MDLLEKLKKYENEACVINIIKGLEENFESSVQGMMIMEIDAIRDWPTELKILLVDELFIKKGVEWPYESFDTKEMND